ncbi:hypothetical protein U1Q18_018361 [Sarracenia purpurea var. burkii]
MALGFWADLSVDLLEFIFDTLLDSFDLLRCRGVCALWRYAAKECHDPITTLLLLPPQENKSKQFGKLVNVSGRIGKINAIDSPPSLAQTRCLYSHRGWLLVTNIREPSELYLYNPLSRVHVQLPSLLWSEDESSLRFIMSGNPNEPNCTVLVFYAYKGFHYGCFYNLGDNRDWIMIKIRSYEDAIYYKNEFYVIDNEGALERMKHRDCIAVEKVPIRPVHGGGSPLRYLVESPSGELLTVARHLGSNNYFGFLETKFIEVYRLDWKDGTWENIRNLDGRALLLAHNDSMFVSVDGSSGYRENCIYFVDDLWVADTNSHSNDYGMYNLETQEIERFDMSPEILNAVPFYRWFRIAA